MPKFKKHPKRAEISSLDIEALSIVYKVSKSHVINILNGHRQDNIGLFLGASERLKANKDRKKKLAKLVAKH